MAVRTLSRLADDLGAIAIAEGVENRADLEQLRWIGVHAAQGYYFARPTTNVSVRSRTLDRATREPGGRRLFAGAAGVPSGEATCLLEGSRLVVPAQRPSRPTPPPSLRRLRGRRASLALRLLFGPVLPPFQADDLPLLDAAVQRVTESSVRDLAPFGER